MKSIREFSFFKWKNEYVGCVVLVPAAIVFVIFRKFFAHWKDAFQAISYLIGAIAALFAYLNYWNNNRIERTKWTMKFFEKFYDSKSNAGLRKVRCLLDVDPETPELVKLVQLDDEDFIDYLNFFEMLAYLEEEKQLNREDIESLFSYYLNCFKKHPSVTAYINKPSNGFEHLSKMLGKSSNPTINSSSK